MLRNILNYLSKGLLKNNREFKDIHKNEECYIIGNGASLKYFDMKNFNNKVSFGCSLMRAHKDFDKMNIKYYITTHPLIHSPLWRGIETGLYLEKNPFYKFWHTINNTGYIQFIHPLDYFFIKDKSNYRFLHNFKRLPLSLKYCDPTKSFSFGGGSIEIMLGLAIYMGFKKAYLVGCDYFFKPYISGHFWSRFEQIIGNDNFFYSELMDVIDNAIDLTVITRVGITSHLKNVQYSDLFGVSENFKKVEDIVSQNYLQVFDNALYMRDGRKRK
jgi:hypothetical protein